LADIRLGFLTEIRRQIATQATRQLGSQFRVLLAIAVKQRLPVAFLFLAFVARIPRRINVVRNFKRAVFPAKTFARQGNFSITEGGTMRLFLAFLVRRTETDNRLAADQRRLPGIFARGFNGHAYFFGIVAIDIRDYLPAVGTEALYRIVGEPAFHFTVDGNAVVIVERDQLAEAERAGERTG